MAKTALRHFKPFHKSIKSFDSLFPIMLLMMRTTESTPRPRLDQKIRKPGPGEEKVPALKSVAIMPAKIEIPNQNKPLMKLCRSITLPLLPIETLLIKPSCYCLIVATTTCKVMWPAGVS